MTVSFPMNCKPRRFRLIIKVGPFRTEQAIITRGILQHFRSRARRRAVAASVLSMALRVLAPSRLCVRLFLSTALFTQRRRAAKKNRKVGHYAFASRLDPRCGALL